MEIITKIAEKNSNIFNAKPVTIAFLGDSVTQGCFEVFFKADGNIETIYETNKSFSANLKKILNYIYPSAQINIINSGISGDNAVNGNKRFKRDIAPFSPDLVVVGFALNDSTQGEKGLNDYIDALKNIFQKIKSIGSECIFLTPNMKNDRVSPHIQDERIKVLASSLLKNEHLDMYVDKAKQTAIDYKVKICDVYKNWKLMQQNGVDITELLANKLNHPNREIHWMTAYELVRTMFEK